MLECLDDRALVERAQSGDRAAFRLLVERYQRKVFAIALGVVRNSDDAMDIVQETFIRVHRNLDQFRGSSSFYTWMYRIVINLGIDQLRRTKKAPGVEYDDAMLHEDDGPAEFFGATYGENPLQHLERSELRTRIQHALEQLSPTHRTAIILREVEGLSYDEMAEVMQCSQGTVMSRLFHARKNLQQALCKLDESLARAANE